MLKCEQYSSNSNNTLRKVGNRIMEKTQVHIKMMSTTLLGGKESANYKTTIPLKFADEDAEAAILEITHQVAEQVYEQWCDTIGRHFAIAV